MFAVRHAGRAKLCVQSGIRHFHPDADPGMIRERNRFRQNDGKQ